MQQCKEQIWKIYVFQKMGGGEKVNKKITEKKISAMKQANHCLDSACTFV